MEKFPKKLLQKLEERERQNMLRMFTEAGLGIDFSSNDYLGLTYEKTIAERAKELLEDAKKVNGSTGSRLLTGNHVLYKKLEDFLTSFHKAEASLVFNSGYDANLGFFACVPQRNDLVLYDEHCHASIRDGIQLSHAKSLKFRHNDLDDLSRHIGRSRNTDGHTEIYVVTESVFSMDGDSPNLKELTLFCHENELRLVVDEAHAVGVFGKGLVNELELEEKIFARIVTFGKALGSHGAAILGSTELKTYLTNFARSLIYTTALLPHSVATSMASYEFLASAEGEKKQEALKKNITYFKDTLIKMDLQSHFVESDSAIQVIVVGGNEATKSLSKSLQKEGFDVRAILSPTVPQGQERLRFCLHSYNTTEQIEKVLKLVKKGVTK